MAASAGSAAPKVTAVKASEMPKACLGAMPEVVLRAKSPSIFDCRVIAVSLSGAAI